MTRRLIPADCNCRLRSESGSPLQAGGPRVMFDLVGLSLATRVRAYCRRRGPYVLASVNVRAYHKVLYASNAVRSALSGAKREGTTVLVVESACIARCVRRRNTCVIPCELYALEHGRGAPCKAALQRGSRPETACVSSMYLRCPCSHTVCIRTLHISRPLRWLKSQRDVKRP